MINHGTWASLLLLALLLAAGAARGEESDYQLGLGYKVSDQLTLGGYFSLEYGNGKGSEFVAVDDLAVLAYGSFTPSFSYLVELESVNVYQVDLEANQSDTNLPPAVERFYGDYKFSDSLNLRFGKFIAPIGYWNLQPINVLRETTSNPRYSRDTYPKFISGLDLYGHLPFDTDLEYHFFVQATEDLDDTYVNIQLDQHVGVVVNKWLTPAWHAGMTAGTYRQIDDTRSKYLQFNTKLESGKFRLGFEAIVNHLKPTLLPSSTKKAMYLQAEYQVNAQHSLIARYDYLDDGRNEANEKVSVLGYSYRPVFPVSLKAEYQWHSDSGRDQFLTSISVLF